MYTWITCYVRGPKYLSFSPQLPIRGHGFISVNPPLMTDLVLETRVLDFGSALRNGFKTSWTRVFFIFWHIWWFFKVECAPKVPRKFEKSRNIPKKLTKNERKPCSTCLKLIFRLIPSTQKSNFGYPNRHYPRRLSIQVPWVSIIVVLITVV